MNLVTIKNQKELDKLVSSLGWTIQPAISEDKFPLVAAISSSNNISFCKEPVAYDKYMKWRR